MVYSGGMANQVGGDYCCYSAASRGTRRTRAWGKTGWSTDMPDLHPQPAEGRMSECVREGGTRGDAERAGGNFYLICIFLFSGSSASF